MKAAFIFRNLSSMMVIIMMLVQQTTEGIAQQHLIYLRMCSLQFRRRHCKRELRCIPRNWRKHFPTSRCIQVEFQLIINSASNNSRAECQAAETFNEIAIRVRAALEPLEPKSTSEQFSILNPTLSPHVSRLEFSGSIADAIRARLHQRHFGATWKRNLNKTLTTLFRKVAIEPSQHRRMVKTTGNWLLLPSMMSSCVKDCQTPSIDLIGG